MSDQLSDETLWCIRERHQLSKTFNARAREMTDEYIAKKVGLALPDVRSILRGNPRKAIRKYTAAVMDWVSKRDRLKSQASCHGPAALAKEYNLCPETLRQVINDGE